MAIFVVWLSLDFDDFLSKAIAASPANAIFCSLSIPAKRDIVTLRSWSGICKQSLYEHTD